MEQKEKFTEVNDEYALEIFEAAKQHFCNGIYVKSESNHPCGWDFISFEFLDDYSEHIELCDISNDIYEYHPYDDLSVLAILKKVGMKGWCFEHGGVDYLE